MWGFIKEYGFMGLICRWFNIYSKYHDMYYSGFKEGQTMDEDRLKDLILYLVVHLPDINPFRNNAICQIRGFADAGRNHYGEDFGNVLRIPEKSFAQKEIDKGNAVFIRIPLGSWDLKSGFWYPNSLLEITADEQYKRNIKNGFPCIRGDCITKMLETHG